LPGAQIAQCERERGSSPKSVTAQGAAREAGGRVKPMAQAVGTSGRRSPSPRSGRKNKAHGASRGNQWQALTQPAKRAKDASAERRFFGCGKGSLCGRRQSTPPLRAGHGQRTPWASLFRPLRGLHHLTLCPPRLAPWAFIYRPLRGLARIRARPHSGWRPGLSRRAGPPASRARPHSGFSVLPRGHHTFGRRT